MLIYYLVFSYNFLLIWNTSFSYLFSISANDYSLFSFKLAFSSSHYFFKASSYSLKLFFISFISSFFYKFFFTFSSYNAFFKSSCILFLVSSKSVCREKILVYNSVLSISKEFLLSVTMFKVDVKLSNSVENNSLSMMLCFFSCSISIILSSNYLFSERLALDPEPLIPPLLSMKRIFFLRA